MKIKAVSVLLSAAMLAGSMTAMSFAKGKDTVIDETGYIGVEAAKAAALADAGFEESEVTFKKTKIDEEDGAYVYEIDFCTENEKYEYEFDAVTGEILEKEIEEKKVVDDTVADDGETTTDNAVEDTDNTEKKGKRKHGKGKTKTEDTEVTESPAAPEATAAPDEDETAPETGTDEVIDEDDEDGRKHGKGKGKGKGKCGRKVKDDAAADEEITQTPADGEEAPAEDEEAPAEDEAAQTEPETANRKGRK
ncbi:MAG: PepSY domain-containing protein [Clostridia bacterium]|nr:PepSY domain-containing protein [Clostridia bacterium]